MQSDYDIWRPHFGQTTGSAVAAAVPEPNYLVLALLGIVAAHLRRRTTSGKQGPINYPFWLMRYWVPWTRRYSDVAMLLGLSRVTIAAQTSTPIAAKNAFAIPYSLFVGRTILSVFSLVGRTRLSVLRIAFDRLAIPLRIKLYHYREPLAFGPWAIIILAAMVCLLEWSRRVLSWHAAGRSDSIPP